MKSTSFPHFLFYLIGSVHDYVLIISLVSINDTFKYVSNGLFTCMRMILFIVLAYKYSRVCR